MNGKYNIYCFVKLLLLFSCIMCAGCVYIVHKSAIETEVEDFEEISTPIKAHLHNGTTVLFQNGAVFSNNRFEGMGTHFSVDLMDSIPVSRLELDEIAAFEIFRKDVNSGQSVALSTFATALTPVLFIAIFGSCPTVYYESDDSTFLEAELFSSSIAPMLEARDITRLNAQPDLDGIIRLEVRNEALETHYINHLELIGIAQKPGSFAVPDLRGKPLSLNHFSTPVSAINIMGADIKDKLIEPDMDFYSTGYHFNPDEVSWDSIELVFDSPDSETAALHIRARNTLFSTVYFYDFLLAGRGLQSLDWLGNDLETVSEAVALGDFHNRYMGIRIDQKIDGDYKEIARVGNVGPIAWKDKALEITNIQMSDSLQIRLRFLSDSWQFDQVRLAGNVEKPEVIQLPVLRIMNSEGDLFNDNLSLISAPDGQYLITNPGNSFIIEFDTVDTPEGFEQAFSLVSQGYYVEWIRQDWIMDSDPYFLPDYSESMMIRVQEHWLGVKEEFEKQFFETKISVQ